MSDRLPALPKFTDQWLLSHIPAVTFFCKNDDALTIRFLQGPEGSAFGYPVGPGIKGLSLSRGGLVAEADDPVLVYMINQAAVGNSPVLARLRLIDADGGRIPVLIAFQGVFSRQNRILGFAGAAIDLRDIPEFQGDSVLFSEPGTRKVWVQKSDEPDPLDESWLAGMLPVIAYAVEDDVSYSVRHLRGPLRRMAGYAPDELIDNKDFKSWSIAVPEDLDVLERMFERIHERDGHPVGARYRVIHLHGHEVPLLVLGRAVDHPQRDGKLVCSVAVSLMHAPALHGPTKLLT